MRKVGGPICSESIKSFEPEAIMRKLEFPQLLKSDSGSKDLGCAIVSESRNLLKIDSGSKDLVDFEQLWELIDERVRMHTV